MIWIKRLAQSSYLGVAIINYSQDIIIISYRDHLSGDRLISWFIYSINLCLLSVNTMSSSVLAAGGIKQNN